MICCTTWRRFGTTMHVQGQGRTAVGLGHREDSHVERVRQAEFARASGDGRFSTTRELDLVSHRGLPFSLSSGSVLGVQCSTTLVRVVGYDRTLRCEAQRCAHPTVPG